MRIRAVCLMAILLVGFMGFSPAYAQDGTNLLTNGGFEDGVLAPWSTYGSVTTEVVTACVGAAIPEGPAEGEYCLHLDVTALGANNYDVGLKQTGHVFEQGKYYTLSAFLKCSQGTLDIRLKPERDASPWEGFPEQIVTITEEWMEYNATTPVFTADVDPAAITIHIGFAVAEFWIDGVRFYEGDYVPPVFVERTTADSPSPDDGAVDVRRDTVLSWEPGPHAETHNVYFGTSLDDVNNAGAGSALLVSAGQEASMCVPPGPLEFGRTYYWRVDEVNAPPDGTVFKGDVWSFTVEPALYPIHGIVATASLPTAEGSGGPETTVDGSGLADGQHGVGDTTMWSCDASQGGPVWIQYDFDQVYKVYQIHVWNYNNLYEGWLGLGFKDVTIEYATEPNEWVTLGDFQLDRGTSKATYAGQTIDVGGLLMRSVRITAADNWGEWTSYGLSEIQFSEKPIVAREPVPADGATEVNRAASLSWRPGREAASHQVYLDTDSNAVAEGTALVDTVATSTYSPSGLNLGTTYYWKIGEVNEAEIPSVCDSAVWSFTTQEYVVIDDFESYTGEPGGEIFNTWADGYDSGTNGSQVGYDDPPYVEQTIRHGGRQSMPFTYKNTGGVANSETLLTFATPQDWTVNGADTLSLWFRGDPVAFLEKDDGTILMSGVGSDIYQLTDEFRFAYKQLTGDGSIEVRVDSIQDTHEWAKAGLMVRAGLGAGTMQAHMIASPRNRVEWMTRVIAGTDATETTTDVNSTPLPLWLRIKRLGDTFTGEYSADRQTWTQIAGTTPTTIEMPNTVYIGLVVCSHVAGTACAAEFSSLSTVGTVTGQWQLAAVGVEQPPGNGFDALYVAVEDSSDKKKPVNHPDNPYAMVSSEWTQWKIPLSDLIAAGVNVRSVKTLYLGVGDKTQPSQNASGVLYIDDVAFGHPIPAE